MISTKSTKPKVLSFVNIRGGCGKSTTAINSLRFFQKFNLSIMLIDCDIQQSATKTAQRMGIPHEEIFDATQFLERIPMVSKNYDLIIIDGPAHSLEFNRSIISESNLVIIPCWPTNNDIKSAENTIKLLNRSQRINIVPTIAVFLNRVTENTHDLQVAQEYFRQRTDSLHFLEEFIPYGESTMEKYDLLFTKALEIYTLAQEKSTSSVLRNPCQF